MIDFGFFLRNNWPGLLSVCGSILIHLTLGGMLYSFGNYHSNQLIQNIFYHLFLFFRKYHDVYGFLYAFPSGFFHQLFSISLDQLYACYVSRIIFFYWRLIR